ncbi:hypothetical protein ANCDUO_01069 [Ancylostoma duodenale]|uniref:Uncharacterized protein n=1 Tax=Ancylostoma duodenale TaxID=51022 RepID=A0A0C2H435_9BILA|nr:hypothetical protein ANCDUO_01069 [Ancylostoma duodenale]
MAPNSPESPESPEAVNEVKEEDKNVDSLPTSKRSLVKEKLSSETQEASEPRPYRIPINQSIPKKRVSDLIARFNQGNVESETSRKNKTVALLSIALFLAKLIVAI